MLLSLGLALLLRETGPPNETVNDGRRMTEPRSTESRLRNEARRGEIGGSEIGKCLGDGDVDEAGVNRRDGGNRVSDPPMDTRPGLFLCEGGVETFLLLSEEGNAYSVKREGSSELDLIWFESRVREFREWLDR